MHSGKLLHISFYPAIKKRSPTAKKVKTKPSGSTKKVTNFLEKKSYLHIFPLDDGL